MIPTRRAPVGARREVALRVRLGAVAATQKTRLAAHFSPHNVIYIFFRGGPFFSPKFSHKYERLLRRESENNRKNRGKNKRRVSRTSRDALSLRLGFHEKKEKNTQPVLRADVAVAQGASRKVRERDRLPRFR